MENHRTYRMMGLVPYNLSPIQQGIQFGHAVVEYAQANFTQHDYQMWAKNDKTFIILNGGTTNKGYHLENGNHIGSLNNHRQTLWDVGINFASFFEPDLGDQLTAVVFLVDDRVFDKVAWPDYNGTFYADGKTPEATEYYEWKLKFAETEKEADQIVFLREFLKNFRLA
jgi:hypothetical protein